jgi:drug/metabolite transporter (DMT)-like permease
MPIFAILLLFASASLHAFWNVLLKQAGNKYLAAWIASLISAAFIIPILPWIGLPARATWGLLTASVLAEAIYLMTLSTAYRDADFSAVYPVARGTSPLFIVLWSFLFFAERLTPAGLVGLGMLISGLLVIGLTSLQKSNNHHLQIKATVFALIAALCISIYTTVDGHAVKQTLPLPYGLIIFLFIPIPISPFALRIYTRSMIRDEWTQHWRRLIAIGIISVIAYILALFAYSLSRVSYAGAIREVSVVIGAFAGWRFLDEKMGGWRVIGAAIIFVGIFIIALWG